MIIVFLVPIIPPFPQGSVLSCVTSLIQQSSLNNDFFFCTLVMPPHSLPNVSNCFEELCNTHYVHMHH